MGKTMNTMAGERRELWQGYEKLCDTLGWRNVEGIPSSTVVALSRDLAQGWELDLFSTIASRRVSCHRMVGKFRLVKGKGGIKYA